MVGKDLGWLEKYTVLIVDDSSFMRQVMKSMIEKDPRFAPVEMVASGEQALELLIEERKKYDIILLDVNMPGMSGLDVLHVIDQEGLACKVIMVSVLVKEGAKETILALEAGALDFILKPTGKEGNKTADFEKKLFQSMEGVLEMADRQENGQKCGREYPVKRSSDAKEKENGGTLVVVASSTGGPRALRIILSKLPEDLDAPMVLIQHMPAGFTGSLAERLNELCEIEVKEAGQQETLQTGIAYVAPGGHQLRIVQNGTSGGHVFQIEKKRSSDGISPSANIMFESIAATAYQKIVCVVLTGMGSDGKEGLRYLSRYKDIYVIAQNMETSVVYGMPKAVVNAGMADSVLALNDIAEEIIRNVGVAGDGQ